MLPQPSCRRVLILLGLVCVTLTLLPQVAAWNSLGHVAVAHIATLDLPQKHIDDLNRLTLTLRGQMNDRLLTLPHNAILLDELRDHTGLFNEFHYITNPYQTGGDYEVPQSVPPPTNAVTQAFAAFRSLHFKGDITRVYGKAFSIFTLVHLIGDLHQPFHAISLFNEHFLPPEGDMGGNLYKIQFTSEDGEVFDQIHKLSDCIGGNYCDYYDYTTREGKSNRDFDEKMLNLVEEVTTLFPKSSFSEDEIAPKFTSQNSMKNIIRAWAAESYNHAVDFYRAVPEKGTPAKDVLAWMRYTFRRRIALAGYRLGYLLKHVDTTPIGGFPEDPDPLPYDSEDDVPMAWRGAFFLMAFLTLGILVVIAKLAYNRSQISKRLKTTTPPPEPTETDAILA